MALKIADISSVIKTQIKNYQHLIHQDDVGTIITVGDGICVADGLSKAINGELIEITKNISGIVFNLQESFVGIIIMGSDKNIKEGMQVKRTGLIVKVPVGDELLGRVVDSLGAPLDGQGIIKSKKMRPIEQVAPGVMTRESVDTPLETGIKIIDSLIPIGRGQRELIIGDRQTGKTAVAIDTIINQKDKKVKCVYVAIGQKASTVSQIVEKLKHYGAMEYTTIVLASASKSAPIQYIAPYAGVTIAEEWMKNGDDVLIVYDDLSKHAVAYRTLSLLLRRPPGREAYPGDIFYLHARLLERACRLNKINGGGSITALPIIETQAGDIAAYIPTNVISITDGQIFMMSELFNSGQRPAVDPGLSVSRVGSTAQIKAIKTVAGSLKLELAQYNELAAFSQFGSDLDPVTKKILDHGAKVVKILQQKQYTALTQAEQVIILFAVKHRYIAQIPVKLILDYEVSLLNHFRTKGKKILQEITNNKEINSKTSENINKELKIITAQFCHVHHLGKV